MVLDEKIKQKIRPSLISNSININCYVIVQMSNLAEDGSLRIWP